VSNHLSEQLRRSGLQKYESWAFGFSSKTWNNTRV